MRRRGAAALRPVPRGRRPAAALGAVLSALALLAAPAACAGEAKPPPAKLATATFAGGCFWCMEPPFEKLGGVVSVTSGYTGGSTPEPSYDDVSAGGTGHAEAVEVVFDPAKLGYARLLDVFWHNVDPTTPNRQFCDVGSQYRSAIFFHDAEQQRLAEASKRALEESGRLPGPIVTEIVPASKFYPAEEYHQDYAAKNPLRYHFYRANCGRDRTLERLWGKAPE